MSILTVRVKVENHFGTERIYPMCENGKRFASIAQTKTLRRYDIETIRELGYRVEVEQPKAVEL